MEDNNKKQEYDEVPVHYCSNCLSLRIRKVADIPDLDFCDECGGTNIQITNIRVWEKLHVERYGFRHLNKHL